MPFNNFQQNQQVAPSSASLTFEDTLKSSTQRVSNNDQDLNFKATLSIAQFKELCGCTQLQIKVNPQNGKPFFVFNSKLGEGVGAVSTSLETEDLSNPEDLAISHCYSNTTQRDFFMLHKKSKGNDNNTIAIL